MPYSEDELASSGEEEDGKDEISADNDATASDSNETEQPVRTARRLTPGILCCSVSLEHPV